MTMMAMAEKHVRLTAINTVPNTNFMILIKHCIKMIVTFLPGAEDSIPFQMIEDSSAAEESVATN